MNKERWLALMSAMDLNSSLQVYEDLCKAYSGKNRFYHNTRHIEAMLKHFDNVKSLAIHPEELELAIWFHDAIYKPLSNKNEAESAKWVSDFLNGQNFQQDRIARVYGLIIATAHTEKCDTPDQQLIVDIDLSILASPQHIYNDFETNVRKEYQIIPNFIYRKKRKEILQSFLEREFIYNTDHFRGIFENQARQNLSRTIDLL